MVVNRVGPSNRTLEERARWRHLANAVERLYAAATSGCATGDGNAAFSQINWGNLVTLSVSANDNMWFRYLCYCHDFVFVSVDVSVDTVKLMYGLSMCMLYNCSERYK